MIPGTLHIQDYKARIKIGCSEEERAYTQLLAFDLVLKFDFSPCISSDRLSDTVDYVTVIDKLDQFFETLQLRLVETLSYRISEFLLAQFQRLTSAETSVKKRVIGSAEYFKTTVCLERK